MICWALKLESRYERKGAGGGGGTHSSSIAVARVCAVATGFLLWVFFVFGSFCFWDLVFFPVGFSCDADMASTSGSFTRQGDVSLDGSLVLCAGGRGFSGSFICSIISLSDNTKWPECSIMKYETWTIWPQLLLWSGCSSSFIQTKLDWSFACTQVSSW